ncbi:hypothetical protein YC2023_059464 [Brassica napus]
MAKVLKQAKKLVSKPNGANTKTLLVFLCLQSWDSEQVLKEHRTMFAYLQQANGSYSIFFYTVSLPLVSKEKNLEHEVHLENFYCQPNNNNKNLISVLFMYYYFLPNNVKNHSPIRMKISKSIVDDEFGVTLVIMIYCWEIPRPFTFFRLGIVGVTGFRRKNIFNGLA